MTADTVGTRYRLVYRQAGRTHVSSVVLGIDEIDEAVTEGDRLIVARSPRGQERIIEVRAFGPLDDVREEGLA